jgi:hypothetical protein
MSTPAALRRLTSLPYGQSNSRASDKNEPGHGGLCKQTALPGAGAEPFEHLKDSATESSPWLLNPVLDTLFCCGGLVWLFFLISYFSNGSHGPAPIVQTLAIVAIVGTHALSEPHTAATLARVYRTAETRRLFATWTHWAALICAALAIAGLMVPGITPLVTKIYLLWVVQHFTSQTFGFALLYCYRAGYQLSKIEKTLLALLMHLTAAFAIIRQLTFYEWTGNGFLAQSMPFWGPLPEWILQSCAGALALVAVAFTFLVAKKALTQGKALPLPACMTIATGILIFTAGQKPSLLLWIFVPAFYHGSQYLVLSAHYHLKRGKGSANLHTSDLGQLLTQSAGIRYYGFLFIAAMFIYVAVPRLLQEFGFSYTLAFATVFATVNIHHFLTDGAIWKLKDQKVRQVLLS